MLDTEITKKIEDFVYAKPRSVQEIAQMLDKNWRTADRYVDEIEKQFGTISTRVFRKETRGALKIVYWSAVDKISHTVFQEKLEKELLAGKKKEDFSAFDIFELVDDKNKKATIERSEAEKETNLKELAEIFGSVKKQMIIFSGDLTFLELKSREFDMFSAMEELVKRNIPIKILCRVDIIGERNVRRVLSLNHKYGKELIEIKHSEQPLRAIVADNQTARIKEVKAPLGEKKIFIFYTIKEREWTEWLSKIFWKMFSNSIGAEKRLAELGKLRAI